MTYPSAQFLNELREAASHYYINLLPETVKHKRHKALVKVYDESGIYELQYNLMPLINEIENSHLLGCNEIIIPHLDTEYGYLSLAMEELFDAINKKLKQCQELVQLMKPLVKLLSKSTTVLCDKDIMHLYHHNYIPKFREGNIVSIKHQPELGECVVVNPKDNTYMKKVGGNIIGYYVRINTPKANNQGFHEDSLELNV